MFSPTFKVEWYHMFVSRTTRIRRELKIIIKLFNKSKFLLNISIVSRQNLMYSKRHIFLYVDSFSTSMKKMRRTYEKFNSQKPGLYTTVLSILPVFQTYTCNYFFHLIIHIAFNNGSVT